VFNYDIDSDEEWIDEPGEDCSDNVSDFLLTLFLWDARFYFYEKRNWHFENVKKH